jgi:hypothetical protein
MRKEAEDIRRDKERKAAAGGEGTAPEVPITTEQAKKELGLEE